MSASQVNVVKSGYYPQQIINAQSLGTAVGSPADYKLNCPTDAFGLIVQVSVTTVLGTGTLAGTASVLSAINELLIKNKEKKYLHDFKTASQLVDISWMFDDYYDKGGKIVADTAISSAGTASWTRRLWARVNAADFPLTFTVALSSLSSLFSTVGSATATLTVIVTPIETPSVGQLQTNTSFAFSITGLTAQNNDITTQLIDRANVAQLAFIFTAEADFTDVTLITPEIEIQSLPSAAMKTFDEDTISGHQTNLLRLVIEQMITLSKNNTIMKINESTADNPTILGIGE